MGMNYYLHRKITPTDREVLERVGSKLPRLHIGKNSWGWQFLFRLYRFWEVEEVVGDRFELASFRDWEQLIDDEKFEIVNEDDEVKSAAFLKSLIEGKLGQQGHSDATTDSEGYQFLNCEFS